ncbi:MAG: chromate efflux transporter [Gemmataceae bacterium]
MQHEAIPGVDSTMAPLPGRLREVCWVFLRLGFTAFGGPAAHIALMEDEFVRRRHWLTREKFLDLLGATNLIPGPNSTEMAIHLGYLRAGRLGLVIAGTCFLLPATLLVMGLARAYVSYGSTWENSPLLYGLKAVVIAVIAQALWNLGRSAIRSPLILLVAFVAAGFNAFHVHELAVLFGAGFAVLLCREFRRPQKTGPAPALFLPTLPLAVTGVGATGAGIGLGTLFLIFLKIGAFLFGSGYVLLAFLRADLVERGGWLTEQQLFDAIAAGQVTPGPVSTTAAFIGYVLLGPLGALVATIGIFLPGFVFVALSGPLIPRIRRSRGAGDFLDGVNAGALALMAVVTWQLGTKALIDVPTWAMALVSLVILVRYRINSVWLMAVGGLLGMAWKAV